MIGRQGCNASRGLDSGDRPGRRLYCATTRHSCRTFVPIESPVTHFQRALYPPFNLSGSKTFCAALPSPSDSHSPPILTPETPASPPPGPCRSPIAPRTLTGVCLAADAIAPCAVRLDVCRRALDPALPHPLAVRLGQKDRRPRASLDATQAVLDQREARPLSPPPPTARKPVRPSILYIADRANCRDRAHGSSVLSHGINHWRRLYQAGRRILEDAGSIINVDGSIVEVWQANLRGSRLSEVADADENLGEDDRLTFATAIGRRYTLVTTGSPILTEIAQRTTLTTIDL